MVSASTKLPKKEPKPGFLCPITQDLMLDPVLLTSSGHTYERAAIEAWLKQQGTDPQTRAVASVQQLIPNRALKETIDHWLKKYPQSSEAELWTAVKANDKKVVERCVLLGVNLAATDKNGTTPLHWIAANGYTEIAKYLVDKDASVEAKDNDGYTPLHYAAENGHTDIAKYLVDKGASVAAKDNIGNTSLHLAVKEGHTELAKYLIDKKAPLDAKTKTFDQTPLHLAAQLCRTEIAKYLIDKGAPLEVKADSDWTPLHLAASYSLTDTVKYLVDNGASVDAKTKYGHTPLHLAAEKNRTEIAKYLVYMGAVRAAKDNNGQTPQQVANATLAQAMDSWPVVTALPPSRLTAELFVLKTKLVEKNELLVNQTQQLTVQLEQVASLSSQLEMLLNWKKEVEQQLPTSTHSVTFFSNKTQTNNKGRQSHHEEASSRSLRRNV